MINVASKCCHSFLCARNTDFHGNAVATLPQYAIVNHAGKTLEFVSFRKFWPTTLETKDIPEFWKTADGGFDGTEGFMDALGAAMEANAAPMTEKIAGAITFDELVGEQTVVTV